MNAMGLHAIRANRPRLFFQLEFNPARLVRGSRCCIDA
jgi:hypothetical protein